MGVVDPEHRRPILGDPLEQRQQRLEGTVALIARGGGDAVGRQLRRQLGEGGAVGGGEGGDQLRVVADQRPQPRDQWRVGDLVVAELDALAAERQPAALADPVQQLAQ